jgi:hypothetical protein
MTLEKPSLTTAPRRGHYAHPRTTVCIYGRAQHYARAIKALSPSPRARVRARPRLKDRFRQAREKFSSTL